MRVLGIDPGIAIVGWAVVEYENDQYYLVDSGSIQTDKTNSDSKRLLEIFEDLSTLVEKFMPDYVSIEKLYYFKNQKTIIPVAEARGVILAAIQKFNIPISEYTPIEVKQVLTGYGRATKQEVMQMVKLNLQTEIPKLDDTTDAIAIAICHCRTILF